MVQKKEGNDLLTKILAVRENIIDFLKFFWNFYNIDKSETPLIKGDINPSKKTFFELHMNGLLETHNSE